MKLSVVSLCLLLLICMVAPGFAATYTLSVPGVTGNYQGMELRQASVDFGQTFSSISSVEIHWWGTTSGFQLGEFWWNAVNFDASLGSATASTFPSEMEWWPFDELDTFYLNPPNWGFLLDGKADLSVRLYSGGYDYYFRGWGSLTGAELILDGTPVPEPSSLMCLGAGLAGCMPFLRRKRR